MVSAAANPNTNVSFQHKEIFLRIVQEGKISLSFKDMIHVSPLFGKFLCSLTTCLKSRTTIQPTASIDSVGAYQTSDKRLYIVRTPHAQVHLNRKICKALIDIGAKINVMTKDAQEWFNLPMRLDPALWLISHISCKRDLVGVCEDVNVSVGGITIKQNIFVVDNTNHVLVLGMPFIIKMQAQKD